MKTFKSPEWISILIASFVAITSTVFGFYTIMLTKEHNKQSVMPLLSAWNAENEKSDSISWSVYNAGLGPAKIKIAKAFIGKKEFSDYLGSSDFRQTLKLNDNMIVDVKWSSIIVQGDIIKDGDNTDIVTIRWKDGKIPHDYNADLNLTLAYCYCSVYDECLYEDSRSGGDHIPLFNCSSE
ncbi:hypothetical protein ACBI01_002434 [Aeromonas veronii]